jgi:hypothetical protein
MGTEFQDVLCDEQGIGGDGEYGGDDNDARLGRINVLTTRPRAANTYHARCFSTSSPA